MAKCNFRGYNKVAYTNRGSVSTSPIVEASYSMQSAWERLSNLGVAIARVRRDKTRYEITTGDTFYAVHIGKSSFYIPLDNPNLPLNFARKVKLGEDNKGMQVLEVATNINFSKFNKHIDMLENHLNPSIFRRVLNFIKSVFN